MSESEELLQFNSSESETEEWSNRQRLPDKHPNPASPRFPKQSVVQGATPWVPSPSLDYSNRRQCQLFGALIVLSMCTYLLSNNFSQNMVVVPKEVLPSHLSPTPKTETGLNVSVTPSTENSSKTTSTSIQPNASTKSPKNISDSDEYEEDETTLNPQAEGCQIPNLNPFDPSVLNITREAYDEPKCLEKYNITFRLEINEDGNSSLILVKPPSEFGWKECCYHLVFKSSNKSDNDEKLSEECYQIPNDTKRLAIPPSHEFLAIFCNSTSNSSHTHIMLDAFALAPLKPEVEDRVTKIYSKLNITEDEAIKDGKMSLLVLGIDAVSHMNFQRTLPKLRDHLVQNLSALWLDGYTKVGDNTYPNLLAMLSNQTREESESNCSKSNSFDNCSLIWKHFSSLGYRTSYGEDSPWMGVFNYLKAGFLAQPTDYYLRPLARVAEEKIKSDHRQNANICYGPRLSLQFILQNVKSLAASMSSGGRKRAYFQFIWATSLTHDYLNIGRIGEPHYLEFFNWMELQGHLDSTVVVLASDHGIRWGPIRGTRQGRIEENMPFLYFMFPRAFRTKYTKALENLRNNRASLTTPFDTHETFLDIANLSRIENEAIEQRAAELAKNSPKFPRGISLFLPIPLSRRCEDADVPEHYCECHATQRRSTSNPHVVQGANYAVFDLNSKISKHSSKCAYLALKSVHYADQTSSSNKSKSWDISFSTKPGNGSFDATVVWSDHTVNGNKTEKKWTVSGSISRTNLYGNQSYCVDAFDMKKYCYCLPTD